MTPLLQSLLLLVAAPALLHLLGQNALVVALYVVVNVTFGALFWRAHRTRRYGRGAIAMVYLASGVLLFHFLVTETARDLALDGRPPAAARMEERLPSVRPPSPRSPSPPAKAVDDTRLAGAPNEPLHRPAPPAAEDEWWSRYVELAANFLRGEASR